MSIDPSHLQSYTEYRGIEIPFLDHLKLRYLPAGEAGAGERLVLRVEREHLNGWNNAHGGVLMTLLDVAMALASSHADEERRGCVTIEMKTSFLRPGGDIGQVLEACGEVRHRTRSIAFCEAQIRNAAGEVVATASGTFKYQNKPRPVIDA
ncbi:PaaI family thioesterase [Pseudomonas citronellolis]|uniref:PaaI family thioesterase n=1 Tax=Pseudomonas citronellolis TaxID=53408 RepID=UPI0023E3C780|nr:PaaI family thioesterase [Pseudomonas citronellolis]MDF3937006.1 PaaI family thioesterase [Pseudomonas citronellolis]